MLFILTNAEDATADFLVERLDQASVALVRLDTNSIISRSRISYQAGEVILEVDGRQFRPSDVTDVWYRRPERLGSDRLESSPEGEYTRKEWTECFEGFFAHVTRERWMNHPASNSAASHKLEQLSTASALGFNVPATILTQDPHRVHDFFADHGGRIIAKPLATGYVKRSVHEQDSLVYTNLVAAEQLTDLTDLSSCPTLFQQYIEKDFDVRVTVVDANMHAVAMTARNGDGSQRCDIRRNNMVDVTYQPLSLPIDVATATGRLIQHYGLRFAAIDFAVDLLGRWYFFEVNPNGQWAWLEIAGNIRISDSFIASFGES